MLKFWASELLDPITRADGAKVQYTVYRDDQRDEVFYIIPAAPSLRWSVPGRELAFRYLKYRTPTLSGGGYATFDVELRVPDDDLIAAKRQLAQRHKLGAVTLSAPPIHAGSVQLIVPTEGALKFESVASLGTPALTGTHVASFAAELGHEASSYFYETLRSGGSSQIIVAYKLKTWARTDDTVLHVACKMSAVVDYLQSIKVRPGAVAWSEGTFRNEVKQAVSESRIGTVELIGGDRLSETARAALRDHGTQLLATALETELDKVLPHEPEDRKAMMSRGVTELIARLDHRTEVKQTLRERFAVEQELTPQGTLPGLPALLSAAAWKQDEKKYFDIVSLDDPFFRTLQAAFKPLVSWTAPIAAVKVDASYHGHRWSTVFTEDETDLVRWGTDTTPAPYLELVGGVPDTGYDYTCEVVYELNGAIQRVVSPPQRCLTPECLVTAGAEGMATLELDVNGLDLDAYTSVEVGVTFLHPDGRRVRARSEVFDKARGKASRTVYVVLGPDAPGFDAFEYTVEYRIGNKRERVGPTRATGASLYVPDRFVDTRAFDVDVRPMPPADATATVRFTFVDAIRGYRKTDTVTIDAETKWSYQWAYGVLGDEPGELRVSAELEYADGTVTPLVERAGTRDDDRVVLTVGKA